MDRFIEVKSALWQKLFILPIFVLFCGVGIAALLTPWVPALRTTSQRGQNSAMGASDAVMAVGVGLFMLVFGIGLEWMVLKYGIRADAQGISQTNGFFRQSALWSEVATYYVARNKRHHKEVQMEPFLLDAQGRIIFQSFAPLLVSTRKINRERHHLWQFVEAQLEGKRVEAPSPDRDPEVLALKSLEVEWSEKSLLWKIARIGALLAYVCLWVGLTMGPIYYALSHNITISGIWSTLLCSLLYVGPLLPHLIWLKWKKRVIARKLKDSS